MLRCKSWKVKSHLSFMSSRETFHLAWRSNRWNRSLMSYSTPRRNTEKKLSSWSRKWGSKSTINSKLKFQNAAPGSVNAPSAPTREKKARIESPSMSTLGSAIIKTSNILVTMVRPYTQTLSSCLNKTSRSFLRPRAICRSKSHWILSKTWSEISRSSVKA